MKPLLKKLEELRDLIKAAKSKPQQSMHSEIPSLPTIKPTSAPSMSAGASSKPPKMPGINPGSKKDPVKVAQQLKQGKTQQKVMPLLKVDKNGQWSLKDDI